MFGVRQVGFLVGIGPIFVAPVGTESKVAILQCSVESKGWVTRIMAPEHAVALSSAGGDAFPYAESDCSIEGYENLAYVELGTNEYLLPDFTYELKGFVLPFTGWKKTTFTAPNVIRNKAEWDYYKGNSGTPVSTTPKPTTTTPTKVPVSNAPMPNSGLLYLGIGIAFLFLLLIITKTN